MGSATRSAILTLIEVLRLILVCVVIAVATMAAASIATALGVVVLIGLFGAVLLLATRTSERSLDILLMLSLAFLVISSATEDPSVIEWILAGVGGLYAARIAWTLWHDRKHAGRDVSTG